MVEPVELTTILSDEDLLLDSPIESKDTLLAAAAATG